LSRKFRENRVKQHLLLTQTDLNSLNYATSLTGSLNRSYFCTEAVGIGLSDPKKTVLTSSRKRRIDIWIPAELKIEIQRLANTYGVTQQAVLRHLILNHAAKFLQPKETEQSPNRTLGETNS